MQRAYLQVGANRMPHESVWFISTIASSVSIALSVSGRDVFNDSMMPFSEMKDKNLDVIASAACALDRPGSLAQIRVSFETSKVPLVWVVSCKKLRRREVRFLVCWFAIRSVPRLGPAVCRANKSALMRRITPLRRLGGLISVGLLCKAPDMLVCVDLGPRIPNTKLHHSSLALTDGSAAFHRSRSAPRVDIGSHVLLFVG